MDPKLLETYEKLGVPLHERAKLAGVAVDAVFDSVSVATTFKAKLQEAGVIFCSFSEAVREHPDLVRKYLGTVVPYSDNFFAALNAAVFSDGSFVYVPKGVRCPMELSTYFRINAANTGQFERTLLVAAEGAYVSYLEGCTAPVRDENQLHAAVVELVALDDAQIKYSTVQNWYPGDKDGKGGIYNFVTKRGKCAGPRSKISWTQVETGSAITWKYPSCILQGDFSVGEFYSVAVTNNMQQADTGTKMIHVGKNTRSTIVSKGISAGRGQNSYRGLVRIGKGADDARNYSQCDSLLIGDQCGAHTFPYIDVQNSTAQMEHEATTSKISEDQLFYFLSRGIGAEDAVSMIVNGFCKEVFKELPMEFAVEAQKLLGVSLEGSVRLTPAEEVALRVEDDADHQARPDERGRPPDGLPLRVSRAHHEDEAVEVPLQHGRVSPFEERRTVRDHVVEHAVGRSQESREPRRGERRLRRGRPHAGRQHPEARRPRAPQHRDLALSVEVPAQPDRRRVEAELLFEGRSTQVEVDEQDAETVVVSQRPGQAERHGRASLPAPRAHHTDPAQALVPAEGAQARAEEAALLSRGRALVEQRPGDRARVERGAALLLERRQELEERDLRVARRRGGRLVRLLARSAAHAFARRASRS